MNTDTVIVGAGTAGLAAAAELGRAGVPAVVLERADAVGAAWRGRYDRLRLNTSRLTSRLPAARYRRGTSLFPTRDEFVRCLEESSDRHELDGSDLGPPAWRSPTTSPRAATGSLRTASSRSSAISACSTNGVSPGSMPATRPRRASVSSATCHAPRRFAASVARQDGRPERSRVSAASTGRVRSRGAGVVEQEPSVHWKGHPGDVRSGSRA